MRVAQSPTLGCGERCAVEVADFVPTPGRGIWFTGELCGYFVFRPPRWSAPDQFASKKTIFCRFVKRRGSVRVRLRRGSPGR